MSHLTAHPAGDLIRLTGSDGRTTCYHYRGQVRITVSGDDRSSTVLHDDAGQAFLGIVTCAGYDVDTRVWRNRIVLYADPLR